MQKLTALQQIIPRVHVANSIADSRAAVKNDTDSSISSNGGGIGGKSGSSSNNSSRSNTITDSDTAAFSSTDAQPVRMRVFLSSCLCYMPPSHSHTH